jgi:hypothetical protein
MILTQKYHSATEIDAEFIPGLEALLRDYIPSFDWIKNWEKSAPENTHFTYYLFFGSRHNDPVGFAQVAIEPMQMGTPWYRKLFNKETPGKIVRWTTPGSSSEGMIFEPMYAKPGVAKAKKIIHNYFDRDDISWQSVTFSQAYQELEDSVDAPKERSEISLADTFVKSGNSYQNYLDELPSDMKKTIKQDWKFLSVDEQMDIGDFEFFKEIFAYRDRGQVLYKNLKKDSEVVPYVSEETSYVTFEKDNEIQAILFLIKGHGNHYFFSWKCFNENITPQMLTQLAVMKFYELQDATHLHNLGANDHVYLKKVGFSSRRLMQVNFRKTRIIKKSA